jgi:hypothetical protein
MADRKPLAVALLGMAAVAGYLLVVGIAMNDASYEVWVALVLVPVLGLLSVPMVRRAAASDGKPELVGLLAFALIFKAIGTLIRYAVAFEVYEGVADASMYHDWGVSVSEAMHAGGLSGLDVGRDATSTGFIRLVTGYVYALIGPTMLGGFFVFSWLGFWGLYLFYRALRIAVPEADHRRYALMIFFLPSMIFWPSSIGKEAWMTLALGMVAFGGAKLLQHERGAIVPLVIGLWATAMVRSHVALLVFAALGVGYLLRRSTRSTSVAPAFKAAGLVVLVVAGTFFVGRFEDQFDVDGVSTGSVDEVLGRTQEQTQQGGSSFEGADGRSITQLPAAAVAVLFRPFPFEARNAQSLFASLEGVVLMVLVARSWGRLRALPRMVLRVPYVALAATYSLGFIVAFSTFGNFGILARQRVQLFPFVLVLLALPRSSGGVSESMQAPEDVEHGSADGAAVVR